MYKLTRTVTHGELTRSTERVFDCEMELARTIAAWAKTCAGYEKLKWVANPTEPGKSHATAESSTGAVFSVLVEQLPELEAA